MSALASHAMAWAAAPLALYDSTRDSSQLAPLAPASPCGAFAVACSAAPAAHPATTLPFEYGGSVSGMIGGSGRGGVSGEAISGWIKPKDLPLTLYFDFQRFQPIGGRRLP